MPLLIRQAQMEIFDQAARERFISDMAAHVATYFPARRAQLGACLYKTLSDTLDKAKTYGITNKRDICKFINVTMTLGPGFEKTVPALHDLLSSHEPPAVKVRRLSEISLAVHRMGKERQPPGRS